MSLAWEVIYIIWVANFVMAEMNRFVWCVLSFSSALLTS